MCTIDFNPTYTSPYNNFNTPRKIKRITRTVEKYNKKGKLISKEVIIEDEEIIENTQWYTATNGTTEINEQIDYSNQNSGFVAGSYSSGYMN